MSSDELFIPIDFEHSCLFFVTKGTRTFLYSERPIEFPKNISHGVPAVDGVDVSDIHVCVLPHIVSAGATSSISITPLPLLSQCAMSLSMTVISTAMNIEIKMDIKKQYRWCVCVPVSKKCKRQQNQTLREREKK